MQCFSLQRGSYSPLGALFIPQQRSRGHSKFGTPAFAALFVAGAATVLTFFGKSVVYLIISVSGIPLSIVFALMSFGVIRLRKTAPDRPRPYRTPFGVVIPYVATFASVCIFFIALWGLTSGEKRIPNELYILGTWIAVGALFWMMSRRQRRAG